MAFESLADKLQNVFKNLRGKGRLSEADVSVQKGLLLHASKLLSDMEQARTKLLQDVELYGPEKDAEKKARLYHDTIVPDMRALRTPVDELEQIVDKDLWPYPSYGDMIFEVSEP